MGTVTHNLKTVRDRITAACAQASVPETAVTLVAVCKHQPEKKIVEAIAAGHRDFGENRVQEAWNKWPQIKKAFPDVRLHLIGPLQTNKVKEAVALFDVLQVVDREKLAEKLAAEIQKTEKKPELFLQVNIGNEPQKSGVSPAEAPGLLRISREGLRLEVAGLMCIPPQGVPPLPYFRRMKEMQAQLGLEKLSMGMSGDFEEAIRCGATHVRVGTAIFGER